MTNQLRVNGGEGERVKVNPPLHFGFLPPSPPLLRHTHSLSTRTAATAAPSATRQVVPPRGAPVPLSDLVCQHPSHVSARWWHTNPNGGDRQFPIGQPKLRRSQASEKGVAPAGGRGLRWRGVGCELA
jgi:hypothetical protein